jgi:hypothetical protein
MHADNSSMEGAWYVDVLARIATGQLDVLMLAREACGERCACREVQKVM